MESCESAGFSGGPREPAPTNTENAADGTESDVTEDTKHDSGTNAERNEHGAEENKRSTKYQLDENKIRPKPKCTPKNQEIGVVFNYSKIKLTQDMENLLNRGFNFSILPLKLDLTQVLVDFKRFERSVIWYEFFYGSESDGELKPKIFKSNKTNLPKNYKSPDGLKTFLGSLKS